MVLVCLFFRAVTLEGAGEGLKFLFVPSSRWVRYYISYSSLMCMLYNTCFQAGHLFSPQVWLEAATQIFFSLGLSLGALVALSSYTRPRYNNLANSVIVPIVNCATSIFASIIVFSIVGFQAKRHNSTPELVSK